MPATLTVPLGDRTVVVRTLTVREIYDWQASIEAKLAGDVACNPAYDLALPDCSLHDLARMCDATADELAEHTHVDLEPVVDAARKLNPPFFVVRAWQAEQILARHALALASARQTQPAPH